MSRRRATLVGGAATLVALAAIVGTVLNVTTSGRQTAGRSAPAASTVDPAHAVPADLRTLLVWATMPAPSEPGRVLQAQLRGGRMPAGVTTAVVLSDEDCAPDAAGISHCRNALQLEDGRRIVVRHPHDMRLVPCLTPGERVVVRPAAS